MIFLFVGRNSNGPLGSRTQSCLAMDDLNKVYNTVFFLAAFYGCFLYCDSFFFEKKDLFNKLAYKDNNFFKI
jgi:hypothetical protein